MDRLGLCRVGEEHCMWKSPHSLYLSLCACFIYILILSTYAWVEIFIKLLTAMHRSPSWWAGSWIILKTVPNVFSFSLPICSALRFICHVRSYQLFHSKFILVIFFLNPPKKRRKKNPFHLRVQMMTLVSFQAYVTKFHLFVIYKMEVRAIRHWLCRWGRLFFFLR